MRWEFIDFSEGIVVQCLDCAERLEFKEEEYPEVRLSTLVQIAIASIDKHVCKGKDANT